MPADDKSWFMCVVGNFGHTLIGPARISEHPLQVGATVAIGALMVYRVDRAVDDNYAINNNGGLLHVPGAMNEVGQFYDRIGTTLFILSSAGALATGGLLANRPDIAQTAGIGLEAVLFTKIYTGFLKRTISRARPFVDEGPRDFDFFKYNSPRPERSMPSGHTSSIFAFVTVLTERHPSWWLRIPAFAFAASVAVQRMESRNHWLSDTFFGASLGYGIGRVISARHQSTDRADTTLQACLLPGGFGLKYNF